MILPVDTPTCWCISSSGKPLPFIVNSVFQAVKSGLCFLVFISMVQQRIKSIRTNYWQGPDKVKGSQNFYQK